MLLNTDRSSLAQAELEEQHAACLLLIQEQEGLEAIYNETLEEVRHVLPDYVAVLAKDPRIPVDGPPASSRSSPERWRVCGEWLRTSRSALHTFALTAPA